MAAKLLFAHLDEIGATGSNERKMLAPSSTVLEFELSADAIINFRSIMVQEGAIVSNDDVRKMCTIARDRREAGLGKIRQIGLAGTQREVVAFLNRRATALQSTLSKARLRTVRFATGSQASAEECAQMQLVIDATLVSASMNAAGCLLLCAPCCGIAAGLYILAAVLQLEKDAACSGLYE